MQSLIQHNIPSDIINAVQQLHRGAKYICRTSSAEGQVCTSNGIEQGCRAAPTLWITYTISVMEELIRRRGLLWLQKALTLFADDFCSCWVIDSVSALHKALEDLAMLLEVLALFKLHVNLKKTALLLSIKGKAAKKLLDKLLIHKAGSTFLKVRVNDDDQLIKVQESHVYLGTVLAYRRRQDLNISHRISSAQSRYQQIRKVLNGRGPLAARWRIRLWSACIQPCLLYSVEVVGCTLSGLQRLRALATRHLRAILRQPAHLSHVTNAAIWATANLRPVEQSIRARMCSLLEKRRPLLSLHGPDIVCNEQVIQQLQRLIEGLDTHIRRLASHEVARIAQGVDAPGQDEKVPCPHCELQLATSHALKIHLSLKHPERVGPAAAQVTKFLRATTCDRRDAYLSAL